MRVAMSRFVWAASPLESTWNWHQQLRADASLWNTDSTASHPASRAGTTAIELTASP